MRIGSLHFRRGGPRPIGSACRRLGFTILEVMLAIGIFALILTAIYSTWIAILKGARVGQKAAAEVQRARVTLRALEDAFTSAELFVGNIKYYRFYSDTSGDMASVELAVRLPETFLGVGKYGDSVVRRISFRTEPGKDGMSELIMTQWPLLMDTEQAGVAPYQLTLARDVSLFRLAFYDAQKNEWMDEWSNTNALPKMVQIALGFGKLGNSGKPSDVVYSLVALPSVGVGPDIQGGLGPGAGMMPGMPGAPGGPGFPGGESRLPGVLQPGGQGYNNNPNFQNPFQRGVNK